MKTIKVKTDRIRLKSQPLHQLQLISQSNHHHGQQALNFKKEVIKPFTYSTRIALLRRYLQQKSHHKELYPARSKVLKAYLLPRITQYNHTPFCGWSNKPPTRDRLLLKRLLNKLKH